MHRARWHRHKTFEYVGRKRMSLDDRIEPRITRRDDGCWSWRGWHNHGYALLSQKDGHHIRIHRWMYEKYVGPLVDGLVIDHICGNRGCVNPGHLRQITNQGNVEHFTKPVRSHNTSGFRGVRFHAHSGLWTASVMVKGKLYLTYHKTIEEAAEAAVELRRQHHTYNDLDRLEAG